MAVENQTRSHDNSFSTMSFQIEGNRSHFETISHFLREDYTGLRELCDTRLRFNTELVPVHSVILAAHSTFNCNFKANKSYELDLSFLNKESVVRILEYLYYGRVVIRFETISDDLDAISHLGIGKLQELVEKQLIDLAKQQRCVDVLNAVTASMKTIPHSLSTLLSISDESVGVLVSILHDAFVSNQLPYEDILKLTSNTVVTMLSSKIADSKKVEVINMALKWIYERRLNDQKASSILRVLTFGSLTYSELVAFRNSLIQTAVPVTTGKCIRLQPDNELLGKVFLHAENSAIHSLRKGLSSSSNSTSSFADPTLPISSPHLSSSNWSFDVDDCRTAMSFTEEDVKRLGFQRPIRK